eukprot:1069736-Amphidinium_carterae.1
MEQRSSNRVIISSFLMAARDIEVRGESRPAVSDNSPKNHHRKWDLTGDDGDERFEEYRDLQTLDNSRKRLLHTQACDGTWKMLRQVSGSVLKERVMWCISWRVVGQSHGATLQDVLLSIDMFTSAIIYIGSRILLRTNLLGAIPLGDFRGSACCPPWASSSPS